MLGAPPEAREDRGTVADYLQALTPQQVAAWYSRLADSFAKRKVGGEAPLSARLLRAWLSNRDASATIVMPAPAHLRDDTHVADVQRYHRRVFLTQERARTKSGSAWAGLLPRLQGWPGFERWDGSRPIAIGYESLVELPLSLQLVGSEAEKDLLYALRGFQLRSDVSVTGTGAASSRQLDVAFVRWECSARDRYDFDPDEHITVPNPDHGSRAVDAVRPEDDRLTVHHRNAQRIERAGLAAAYDLVLGPWPVARAEITGPARIDRNRRP